MARAINSLPTPDSPSISTGMLRGGGLLGGAQRGAHRRAAGDDVGEGERAVAAVPDALQFALQRAGVERVAQRHLQPLDADRLDDEVAARRRASPTPHCRCRHARSARSPGWRGRLRASSPARPCRRGRASPGRAPAHRSQAVLGRSAGRSRRRHCRPRRPRSRNAAPCSRPGGAARDRRRRSELVRPCVLQRGICPDLGHHDRTRVNAL